MSTTSNFPHAFLFSPLHVFSDIFPTKALCLTASALGSFIHSFIHPPMKYLLNATVRQTLSWALRIQMNSVRSFHPGQSPGVHRARLAVPSQSWTTGSRCLSQHVLPGRGLANCQTKGFPKVKLDVRDLNPAGADISLGTRDQRDRGRRGPGWD